MLFNLEDRGSPGTQRGTPQKLSVMAGWRSEVDAGSYGGGDVMAIGLRCHSNRRKRLFLFPSSFSQDSTSNSTPFRVVNRRVSAVYIAFHCLSRFLSHSELD
jgi:hypothetical protein